MGKFEKLVILTVLFAAAIVLAITFNRGEKKVEAGSPLTGAQELLGEEPGLGAAKEESKPVASEGLQPAQGELPGSLALNAGDEPAPEAPAFGLTSEPVANRDARILVDTTGLRPSFLEEYMVYTVAEGDTWSSLAQRFFQDGRYTRNLHQANDGMSTLVPGGELLVPVFDFVQADAGLQSGTGVASEPVAAQPLAAEPSTPSFLPADSNPAAEAPVTPAPAGGTLEYVVASGDTLSGIALAALGSAQKWPELLELNKDKLPKPEALKVGMKLKLPAGAKLPSASSKPVAKSAPKASQPKASESKPTAKKEAAPEAAPKKKKKVL